MILTKDNIREGVVYYFTGKNARKGDYWAVYFSGGKKWNRPIKKEDVGKLEFSHNGWMERKNENNYTYWRDNWDITTKERFYIDL